ncbi:unnamed protein product [Eruca vesicaria subsp. sativa]|uniref:RRM domain-containing protein n=1 Tax=Eruca vesicaria subsp. sativa TaxID=29727 RepID=A0ABC8L806_ERUVS|nr:unnamed protein product [Eruca vesicaria subsp. sativa]
MDESAIKGVELNGSDAENRTSRISRILVEGHDISRPRADVHKALREHFASCGDILDVYLPTNFQNAILSRYAFIYVNSGEGQEEALRLNGSDMGGRIVRTESYPFHQQDHDDYFPPMSAADQSTQRVFEITGFDTSLTKADIHTALDKHLRVQGVSVYGDYSSGIRTLKSTARIYTFGHANVEKALELSGSHHVEGFTTFVVTRVLPLLKSIKMGYTIPRSAVERSARENRLRLAKNSAAK